MLKIKNLFQKKAIISILPATILFFVLLIVYFPSFNLQFSLLDDGLTVRNARLISESIYELDINKTISVLLEPENGRVRPAYWLAQSLLVWFSNYNASLLHINRFLILLISLFVANKILIRLNVHKIIRMFVFMIYGFNFQNLENYFRLGPTEPFLVLYYVVLIYLLFFSFKTQLKKSNLLLFFIIFLLGTFTKESFFLVTTPWIIGHLFLYFSKKKDANNIKTSVYLVFITVLLAAILFFIRGMYPGSNNYSSNYTINVSQVLTSLKTFGRQLTFYQPFLFEFSVLYSLYLFYKTIVIKKLKRIESEEIIFMIFVIQALLQLAVLLPWKYALDRYLALVNINLLFIYGYVIMEFYKFINNKFISTSKLLNQYKGIIYFLLLTLLAAQFFVRSYFADANYQLFQKVDSETSKGSVEMISKQVPINETVYVNYIKGTDNIEIYKATGWHLEELYNRKDILFEYLDQGNLCSEKERYIFDRKSARFLDLQAFDNENFLSIDGGESIYRPINYGVVIRSFYYKQKLPGWDQIYPFDWNLYLQKSGTCIEEKYIL